MNEVDTKAKQQIVEKIKNSKNILIIVSKNPSVDDLSAAIGLTALLNKTGKHATAIFSGVLPPAIAFLDPTKVFENTVNSLRDFIIALDKEKADHLRYKIEGDLVKIFITPYRTTISGDDLEFSQGDYNVELVLALGVASRENLDLALASDAQVLNDATVATFCAGTQTSDLGSICWRDENAGCLSEMIMSLSEALKTDKPLLDKQIATAFLTGIVASTDRFSNEKTTSKIMTMSAQLMAAGADQQLIAARLRDAHEINFNTEIPKPEKRPEYVVPDEVPQIIATPMDVPAPVIEPPVVEPVVDGSLSVSHDEPIVTSSVASTLPEENADFNIPQVDPTYPTEEITPYPIPEPAYVPEPDNSYSTIPAEEPMIPVQDTQPSSFINTLSNLAAQPVVPSNPVEAPQIPAPDQEPVMDTFSPSTIPDHEILTHSYLGNPQPGTNSVNENVYGLTPDDNVENVDIFASSPISTVPPTAPQIDLPMPPELPDFSSLPPSAMPNVNTQPISTIPAQENNQQQSDPGQFKIPS